MLIYPLFITDNPDEETPVPSFPGQYQRGINKLIPFLTPLVERGLKSVILFGVPLNPTAKDHTGSQSCHRDGPVVKGIQTLKSAFKSKLFVVCDVCLCEYTSHGHCGVLHPDGRLNNALSVQRIKETAIGYAVAGADCVAPSDMNDGRVRAIKEGLREAGLENKVLLMSYAAKFAGNLYGPFRDAAGSAPTFGDRKCYQLPPSGKGLARRAILRDLNEGADIIMVKPASAYLDIIADAKELARNVCLPMDLLCFQGSDIQLLLGPDCGIPGLGGVCNDPCGCKGWCV